MKTYRKSDMFLTGWGSNWQTAKIVEEAIRKLAEIVPEVEKVTVSLVH